MFYDSPSLVSVDVTKDRNGASNGLTNIGYAAFGACPAITLILRKHY